MSCSQQENFNQLKLLNKKAKDDFEQMGIKMCTSPYKSIMTLSRLCDFAASHADLQLPLRKSYKFIHSAWVHAALHQIVNEGLSVWNKALAQMNWMKIRFSTLANDMLRNLYCTVMLQDVAHPILVRPYFMNNVHELKKLILDPAPKFKPVVNVTSELEKIIKESDLYSPSVREELVSALANLSMEFDYAHHMWTCMGETVEVVMSTFSINNKNELAQLTLTNAHKAAWLAFQSAAITTICDDNSLVFQLTNMDELIAISLSSEATEKQEAINESAVQLLSINEATAQTTFEQYISDSEDMNKAITATKNFYCKVTIVRVSANYLGHLIAKLDDQGTYSFENGSMLNYTFPQIIEYDQYLHNFKIRVFTSVNRNIHEYVGDSDMDFLGGDTAYAPIKRSYNTPKDRVSGQGPIVGAVTARFTIISKFKL